MEFLSLAGGYILGLMVAWFSFNQRCRRRLAEQEAGYAEARCRAEQALEWERAAHEATRQRLSEIEVGAGATEVCSATAQQNSEHADLKAPLSAAYEVYARLDAQFKKAREEDGVGERDRTPPEAFHQEARSHQAATGEDSRSQLADLESRQNDREDHTALQKGEPITLQAGHETPSAMPPALDEGARDSDSEAEPPMMDPAHARSEVQGIGAVLNDEIARLKAELGTSPARPGGSREAAPCSDQSEPEPRSKAKTPSMEPVDDLIRIDGIGPVLKDKLTTLGIISFRQIADFTQADIDGLARALNFRGRIKCEKWVEQAKALAQGRPPT